jgi:hypothetical protein
MAYDLLGSDILGDDDMLGADDDILGADDDILGAARSSRRRGWRAQLRRGAPGAPAVSEMMMPLGLGGFTFTNTTPLTANLSTNPQLAFRPERLVLVVTRSSGATAIGVAVTDIKVGQRSQLVSPVDIPAEAFGPTAFGVRLALDPCTPGILVTVSLRVTAAPGTGESVTVIGALIGRSVG